MRNCFLAVLPSLLCLTLAAGVCLHTQSDKEPFTFDDFMNERFGQRGYGSQWISDTSFQLRDNGGNIIEFNVETNQTSIIVKNEVLQKANASSYTFSPNRNLLLIGYDVQAQFRHSTTARFTVYDLRKGTFTPVANASLLQTAAWSPVGNGLLYVQENDIYYTPDFTVENSKRVTTSGVPGVIYNGVPDWVYEEEVLAAATAYWFSPDGKGLVFLEFNDTQVPETTYLRYGKPGTLEDQYPKEETIRYPKSGAKNPGNTAYYVNLNDVTAHQVIRSDPNGEKVSFGFAWLSNSTFVELLKNRIQNESVLRICPINGECTETLKKNVENGWDKSKLPRFHPSGEYYVGIESIPVDDKGHFDHLLLRRTDDAQDPYILSSGEFAVLSIIGWRENGNIVYFSASQENKISATHVYGVSNNAEGPFCLTCDLTTPEGNACTSGSARFSTDYTYVVLTCSGPDPTTVALYRNEYPLGEPLLVLEDNSNLRNLLKTKAIPSRYDTKVNVPGGFQANVRLLLPPNFDESKKYPLLINVYGGPDNNQVGEGFFGGWDSYLTTSLNVIYGYIDGRGSGRGSNELIYSVYRNLGFSEIEDQINVTRELQNSLSWIDKDRTGIWGWSYGGYATGRTLELDTEGVFKCGISVAPVTSWLYYDSIYTERYMSLPTEEDNLSGYQAGDLVSHVDNLKTKKYYLIHGNADDNVHYQQSMLLSRALELDDVLFQQQSYPDENHRLAGVTRHLYHSMDTFWKNCFNIVN